MDTLGISAAFYDSAACLVRDGKVIAAAEEERFTLFKHIGPILINTSFNTRSKPIVCTPQDALETFWTSPLDALVMGSFLIEKG